MIPVVLLLRVSTDRQETDRQETELRALAVARGWDVVAVVTETVTGRANAEDRAGLREVEALALAGKVRKVLVHEVSRLSRRPSVAHGFVERLEQCGVSLYWHAQSIETLLPDGRRNPAAAIMLAVLAEMARAETDTLRERINSGLAEARRKGVKLGRPPGSVVGAADFLAKHRDVVKLLREGQSVRHAAAITKKGTSTVMRVATAMKGGQP